MQINVIDDNDNPPYFQHTLYNATIEETASPGTRVISVRADDRDTNNVFSYNIVEGNLNQAFAISQTGDITVLSSGKLDYETKYVSGDHAH